MVKYYLIKNLIQTKDSSLSTWIQSIFTLKKIKSEQYHLSKRFLVLGSQNIHKTVTNVAYSYFHAVPRLD